MADYTDARRAEARKTIIQLLSRRDPGKTICPSDAARAMDGDAFRALMPTVRAAAQDLVEAGEIDVTQRGEVVDLAEAKGAIRLRLRPSPDR